MIRYDLDPFPSVPPGLPILILLRLVSLMRQSPCYFRKVLPGKCRFVRPCDGPISDRGLHKKRNIAQRPVQAIVQLRTHIIYLGFAGRKCKQQRVIVLWNHAHHINHTFIGLMDDIACDLIIISIHCICFFQIPSAFSGGDRFCILV